LRRYDTGSGTPWDGTTRDYHYDELLGRVFGILREKNPALSEKTKTIIKPPQVLREAGAYTRPLFSST
jgi:translation initiation factor 2 subunit 2